MDDCVFCKIVKKKIAAEIIFESDKLLAFPDKDPSAETHILIVPKEHIKSFNDLREEHGAFLVEVYQTASKLVKEMGLDNDLYRVIVNGGRAQHVPHLHFHLLGGQWKKQV
jgi:histidine triad (HIT) family protein